MLACGKRPESRVRGGERNVNDEVQSEEAVISTDTETEPFVEDPREKPLSSQPAYGFWVIVVAMAVVGGAFAGALIKWGSPKDVVTTMGVVTGAISALVAAFFGVRAGAYAQSKDVEREKHRDRVHAHRDRAEHAQGDRAEHAQGRGGGPR